MPLAGSLAARCSAFDPVRAQRLGLVLTPVLVLALELGHACAASNTSAPDVLLADQLCPERELVQPICYKTRPWLLVHRVGVAQGPSFVGGLLDGVVVPGFEVAAEVGLAEAELGAVEGGVGSWWMLLCC